MQRRRHRSSLLIACAVLALAACGKDTPEKAVYEVAHGIEMKDAEAICSRLVNRGDLPRALVAGLDAPPLAIAAAAERGCPAASGREGQIPLAGARVLSVALHDRQAAARVKTDAKTLQVPVVKVDGSWKVVYRPAG